MRSEGINPETLRETLREMDRALYDIQEYLKGPAAPVMTAEARDMIAARLAIIKTRAADTHTLLAEKCGAPGPIYCARYELPTGSRNVIRRGITEAEAVRWAKAGGAAALSVITPRGERETVWDRETGTRAEQRAELQRFIDMIKGSR